jgi:hypothetical protein
MRGSLRHHFTAPLSDVSFTVYALFPTLFDQIADKLDVESSFAQLRDITATRSGAPSITDSQQLSVASDDGVSSSSAVNVSTIAKSVSSPPAQRADHSLPESWASEFAETQRAEQTALESTAAAPDRAGPTATRVEDVVAPSPSVAYASSIDGESVRRDKGTCASTLLLIKHCPNPRFSPLDGHFISLPDTLHVYRFPQSTFAANQRYQLSTALAIAHDLA